MSRYNIEHGDKDVVVGWDNPTQSFFCQVWGDDEDAPEAQTDSLPPDAPRTLSQLLTWTEAHGIIIPAVMQAKLEDDWHGRSAPTALQLSIKEMLFGGENK